MQQNVTMKILGDYVTQCYDEDIWRLYNTMLRWRYWETIQHNVTMKILGDYATQCYDEDIWRLCNTMLQWRYWETMQQNVTMKVLGDYATQCYDGDIGRLCNTMLRWSRERLESQPSRADDEVCRKRRAVFIASPPRAGINIAATLQHILGRWDVSSGLGTRKKIDGSTPTLPWFLGYFELHFTYHKLRASVTGTGIYICHLT